MDLESGAAGGAPHIAEPAVPLGDHRASLIGSGCNTRHEPESTMTDHTMPLLDALLKRGGGDFMKELAEEVLACLIQPGRSRLGGTSRNAIDRRADERALRRGGRR